MCTAGAPTATTPCEANATFSAPGNLGGQCRAQSNEAAGVVRCMRDARSVERAGHKLACLFSVQGSARESRM